METGRAPTSTLLPSTLLPSTLLPLIQPTRTWPPSSLDQRGFTLLQALVSLAVIGTLAWLALGRSHEVLARLQVELAARRLLVGLERGREAAERIGQPCGLKLTPEGWRGAATAAAEACDGGDLTLQEGLLPVQLRLEHSFAAAVKFTANGLAIDGGTAVVGASGTELVRCVVMSPPLGVTRLGRYTGQPGGRPDPARCLPDAEV